ncbi:esterase family protein [bacterium]|nr:esterase family protein [bacterium]
MIEWIEFESPKALRGFPMGDSPKREFPVYLPPGFSTDQKGLPTVYFLSGYGARGSVYLSDDSAFGRPLQARLDAEISAGKLPPFIGVFPDCTSRLGHSQYINSQALGNYMDYLCDELVPLIDETFAADPTRRAVVGHSSGGFGALVTAMLRPGVFHGVSASASDSFFENLFPATINRTLIEVTRAGGVEAFLTTALTRPSGLGSNEFEAVLTLAMAPCYAPEPAKGPLYGELFFDLETGEIHPEFWKRYLAWDPIHLVDKHASALKKLKVLSLECGMQDEHGLQWGHRQIARKLHAQGVEHKLIEYPGGHRKQSWRLEQRVQRVLEKL